MNPIIENVADEVIRVEEVVQQQTKSTTKSTTKGRAVKAGIAQMPWRDPVRGKILWTVILRVFVADQHSFRKGTTLTDMWQVLSVKIYKQPEFTGIQGSANSLRTQFDKAIASRAHFHGWLDANGGVVSNLSDKAGDLDELDSHVRQILMEQEVLEAKKRLAAETTEKINGLENIVLKNGLTNAARIKRQDDVTSTPSKPTPTSPGGKLPASPSSIGGLIDQELLSHLKSVSKKRNKDAMAVDESVVEQRLVEKFKHYNEATFLVEAGLALELEQLICDISLPVIFSVFCSEEKQFSFDYFKKELVEYGVSPLVARKIHLFLKGVSETCKKVDV